MPLRLERRNSRVLLVALIALAAPTLPGCGGGGGGGGTTPPSFTASFTPSTTAAAANLIKLAEVSKSGARITLAVTVYGPTTGTDAYTYAFDLQIADPSVAGLVTGSAAAGSALVACPGQQLEALATQDSSGRIVASVSKLGNCAGNGVAGASAPAMNLSFDVKKAGTTTISFVQANSKVLDSTQPPQPIASFQFDSASATLKGQ